MNKYYKKPGGFVSDDPPEKTPLQVWNDIQKLKWKGINERSAQGRALIKQYNDLSLTFLLAMMTKYLLHHDLLLK